MESSSAGGEAVQPPGISSCPSFNSYSNGLLANLAREVEAGLDQYQQQQHNGDDCDDFEFVPIPGDVCEDGFVVSSDQIGPAFPVFNRDLLLYNGYGINGRDSRSGGRGGGGDARSIRIPLMDLFVEEDRDPMSYSTSSEADEEIEGIPEGSYCVWTPRDSAQSSPSWCKKSNSTGSRSSRRWKFLDLLRRSNSDGKNSFVFLTPSSSGAEAKSAKDTRKKSGSGKSSAAAEQRMARSLASTSASGLEVFYTRSKVAVKGGGAGNRRKSYLPYRQDLVGFFANVNSLGRTFPPFG